MRRFEFRSDSSSKFWEVEQDDAQLNLRWGKIGTHGQSQSKPFADAAKAAAAMTKLIAEKTGKGYVEAQVAAGASIGATAQPAPAAAVIAQDAAPASPPQAQPPEPAAPPPAAAMAPATRGDTPPWLEQGAAVLMPESLKDLALPSRRYPGDAPAEPLDPMRAWLRVRESLLKHLQPDIDASAAHWQAAYAEAWQRVESRRMEGSSASDAVLMTILVKLSSQHYRDDVELGANGMAFMAGRLGLEGAVDALLSAQTMGTELGWVRDTRKRRLSLNDNVDSAHGTGYAGIHSDAEWALRALLARAEPAQWQACADKIRVALPLLPPSRQPAMAMLLPDLPELSNETAQRLQGPQAPASLHWLQMTVTDPAALALAQRQKVEGWGAGAAISGAWGPWWPPCCASAVPTRCQSWRQARPSKRRPKAWRPSACPRPSPRWRGWLPTASPPWRASSRPPAAGRWRRLGPCPAWRLPLARMPACTRPAWPRCCRPMPPRPSACCRG
ncbi:regulator [Cupriavidus basilensis OR16]|uniref:Regulator n=1 Tax=Cupriavidus basilensis OR16 TaxID=1127483 RepID=H1S4U5_9BURK|nr:WGR domain-containing protein [Cupriavidus basilensis]EHP42429.1 regulator [Cupriavidus basilensis OR16]